VRESRTLGSVRAKVKWLSYSTMFPAPDLASSTLTMRLTHVITVGSSVLLGHIAGAVSAGLLIYREYWLYSCICTLAVSFSIIVLTLPLAIAGYIFLLAAFKRHRSSLAPWFVRHMIGSLTGLLFALLPLVVVQILFWGGDSDLAFGRVLRVAFASGGLVASNWQVFLIAQFKVGEDSYAEAGSQDCKGSCDKGIRKLG